jgi:hypothetical protein
MFWNMHGGLGDIGRPCSKNEEGRGEQEVFDDQKREY